MKSTKRCYVLAAMAAAFVTPFMASADPVFFTNEASWNAAILSIDASAIFGGEDFNGVAVDGATLGAGPHSYGGGDFDITLNDIGNGGSFNGVVNSGDFDGSNAFQGRIVFDSSDFFLFPGCCLGEGVQSMDFAFGEAVLGFAAEWSSVNTHDSVLVNVNGSVVNLKDFLPDDNLNDGDGFFGFVDLSGISSFSLTPPGTNFEEFEMDDMQFAKGNPIPAPGAAVLAFIGLGMVGWVRRRFA